VNPEEKRDGWIDAARGLAALSVVLFHFNAIPSAGAPLWRLIWRHGYLGVPVFFVLSGWCITASWLRSSDWRTFAVRRARRILPAYYCSLALVLLVAAVTTAFRGVNDVTAFPRGMTALVATCTLATAPVTSIPTVNWVYWSLSYEAAFYLILGIILPFAAPRQRPWRLVAVHVLLCGTVFWPGRPQHGVLFFADLWPLFGLGAALALYRSARPAALTMLVAIAAWAFSTRAVPANPRYLTVAVATAAALVASPWVGFPRFLGGLRQIGLFSYSLYLVHVPLGIYCVLRLLPDFGGSSGLIIARQLVALGLVLSLAWLFHLGCERPFLRAAPVPPAAG